jgi:hypothetical protein
MKILETREQSNKYLERAGVERLQEVRGEILTDVADFASRATKGGEGSAIARYRLAENFLGLASASDYVGVFISRYCLDAYNVGLRGQAIRIDSGSFRLIPEIEIEDAVENLPIIRGVVIGEDGGGRLTGKLSHLQQVLSTEIRGAKRPLTQVEFTAKTGFFRESNYEYPVMILERDPKLAQIIKKLNK